MKRALHPLRVVMRRTGLSADLIRVWERRYAAVAPERNDSNRRLYSDGDVERLQLLARATQLGRHVGQVASLDTRRLRALVEDEEKAQGVRPLRVPRAGATRPAPARLLEEAMAAVHALSGAALERLLGQAAVSLPRAAFLEEVVAPLMIRIGTLWEGGTLRVAQEHLASAEVRIGLAQLARPAEGGRAPVLVVATPPGQLHEFGALLAALEAEDAGFDVAYLGPNLPMEEIAAAASALHARAVALSLVYPGDDARLPADLARLRRLLGADTALIVGGGAAGAYDGALAAAQAERLPTLGALRSRLQALRASAA